MPKPLHTPEQKQRAVDLAIEHGPIVAVTLLAVEGIDVKVTTLRSWCSRAGVATKCNERTRAARDANQLRWEERRLEMVHDMGAVAEKALERTTEALDNGKGRDAKEYALTMAILMDKAQLLSGGATSRSEHSEPAQAAEQLLDELAQRRNVA